MKIIKSLTLLVAIGIICYLMSRAYDSGVEDGRASVLKQVTPFFAECEQLFYNFNSELGRRQM